MRTILKPEYEEMLQGGDILEKDQHGVKVVRLEDGLFLKTFWFRHKISSRRIFPEPLRFLLHERALKKRQIPTITMIDRVQIPHLNRTGVLYDPLPGRTLRQVAAAGEFDAALAGRLGSFVATLHQKGIHFHSLHLGNILLCPDEKFGLIDISDMKTFPWPLFASTRRRNFNHLFRYEQDLKILKDASVQSFVDGYISVVSSPRMKQAVRRAVRSFLTP